MQTAALLVDVDMLKGSVQLQNYTGPADQMAAVYLHLQLAGLIERYDRKQQHRRWFDVYDF